jgi:formamidopyrimidine-DNA glycosylase
MPELPEVERIRQTLLRLVVGRRVVGATLRRRDVCTGRKRPADLLVGATIADVRRHGKQLAVVGHDGRVLCVHLGMTGQITVLPPAAKADGRNHVHAVWRLDPPGRLAFRDPRRFGGLWTFPSMAALVSERWSVLGADALTIAPDVLGSALGRTQRAVKAALLDQAVLAGVGNIYADESLFIARLHPGRNAGTLSPAEVARLAAAIRTVLADAVAAGGSTLRDYTDADGQPGSYQRSHRVYARGGLPCVVCTRPLRQTLLAQRTTTYCSRCQPV